MSLYYSDIKHELLLIVYTGRLDDLIKFLTTKGFSEEDVKKLSKPCLEKTDETPLLETIARSFQPMFEYLIEMNVPVGQTGRFDWNGKEYFGITPMLAAIISNQHSFVEHLIQRHEKGTWLGNGERTKKSIFAEKDVYGCGECERTKPLGVSYLIARENKELSFSCPSSSIMSSSLLSPMQNVDVLELIGSVFILHTVLIQHVFMGYRS